MAAQPPSECITVLHVQLAQAAKFQVSFCSTSSSRKITLARDDDFGSDDELNMEFDLDLEVAGASRLKAIVAKVVGFSLARCERLVREHRCWWCRLRTNRSHVHISTCNGVPDHRWRRSRHPSASACYVSD